MGASEGGSSCVSGPPISLLLPLLHPTQCPPMTACSWQGWCHPRPSCPLLGGSSWLPPQPPAVSHLCQGAGWGGARGWRIGGGEGARSGQRCSSTSLSLRRGNASRLQRLTTNVTSACPLGLLPRLPGAESLEPHPECLWDQRWAVPPVPSHQLVAAACRAFWELNR